MEVSPIVTTTTTTTSPQELSMMILSSSEVDFGSTMDTTPFLVAFVALAIGAAAQTFINQMLEGDQGLGAFLKDGAGYNKSGFRQSSQDEIKKDPLPWLQLPKLDFVEVAGQEQDDAVVFAKLEDLRVRMNQELELGNQEQASILREQLEQAMEAAGIEYTSEWD